MDLKEQVKLVRRKLFLTQSQLSEETGISAVTIARWESVDGLKPQMVSYGKFIAFCESKGIRIEPIDNDVIWYVNKLDNNKWFYTNQKINERVQ